MYSIDGKYRVCSTASQSHESCSWELLPTHRLRMWRDMSFMSRAGEQDLKYAGTVFLVKDWRAYPS